jgi:GntR family transcriptional regulator
MPPRMLIVVDHNSGVPVFRQIIDQVRFHIASGLLGAGDELPSTRALSQQLGVNPMTVSKAYSLLEEDRMIQRRAGLSLIVRAQSADAVDGERLAHLRAALEPARIIARQLGISTTKAAGVFRRMLDDAARNED